MIITRDGEDTIGATLESLRGFAEVIVYDNGSRDRTIDIAREYTNVCLHEGEFLGFGPTKNRAADLARHDWVFLIDSDESVSAELFDSIAGADRSDPGLAYSVLRGNYLRGKLVRHSGWGGDWLLRLYNRTRTGVSDAPVHENVLPPVGGRVARLSGELSHDAVRELSQFLVKIDRYSELRRSENRRLLSPPVVLLRSVWAFLRVYFLQFGFLDGWRGLVIAVGDANGVFYKYMKPWADRHD
ncbi:MAG: glycosyltransferase family 2 protein [Gammaproteobacteria bacterium]